MVQILEQKLTRDVNPLSRKNDATVLRNTLEENCKTHWTFWIFSKSICNDVLEFRALINFISEVISQIEMLHMCSEDPLSTDREYNMQLLETSSVHWDEIVDNHRGDLGQDDITRWELRTSGRLFDKIFTSNFRNSLQKNFNYKVFLI